MSIEDRTSRPSAADPLHCFTVYDVAGLTVTVTTLRVVPEFAVVAPATVVIRFGRTEVGRAEDERLSLAPRRRLPEDLAWAGRCWT